MGLEDQLVVVGRVALAALLGYLVGLERAYRGKDAGDRTFALIALGSAAFVGMAVELFPFSADRVVQGVIVGVGFLGGGVIFRAEGAVHGLTTAAASWVAAAIGSIAGGGLYLSAVLVAVLAVVVLELHQVAQLRRHGGASGSVGGAGDDAGHD
jgi:putative Mg2+ transporter-C (MgtC) family protein